MENRGSLKEVSHKISTWGFFHESVSPGPLSVLLGLFGIFTKIRRDIRNFVFIVGVSETGKMLFTGVNDTDDKLERLERLAERKCLT